MLARCIFCRFYAALLVLVLAGFPPVRAAEPRQAGGDSAAAARAEAVSQLVARLDSPSFSTREAAMRDLRAMLSATEGHASEVIARLFQFSLDPKVSFEAQQCLEGILVGVELPASLRSEVVSDKEIAELVGQLSDNRFTVRETAIRRLDWVLRNPANIVATKQSIEARLGDSKLPAATRQELARHYDTVRRAWLLAPEKECPLPPVGEQKIAEFISVVSASAGDPSAVASQQFAIRELQDLLCREEYRAAVTEQVAKALEASADPAATARLRELADLARPAMVAEIWSPLRFVTFGGGLFLGTSDDYQMRLATMQYLHIGVPQVPENAPRATYFDRCDDKTAHCVSGNSLKPGDYPVGTAILHPDGEPTVFHLINLPTPRRRLIYEYSASTSETVRLRDLSQKTCDAFVSKERVLTSDEVSLLGLLDRAVVAEFAGRYFQAVDDAPLPNGQRLLPVGSLSRHGAICYALASSGTRDAAPAIIKAIEAKRFLPPGDGRRYDLPHIALLSIARRDPWKNANDWLGAQLSRQVPLIADTESAPDLAATAAAILLARFDKSLDDFGLEESSDDFCQHIRLPTYRFRDDTARQAVLRWWLGMQEIARAAAR